MLRSCPLSLVTAFGTFAFLGPLLHAAVTPDFTTEVRPVLSKYCFSCHGPDEEGRKGKLRLDIRENAYGKGKSGEIAITPGQPDHSEVIVRIFSEDEDELMPPPKAKKPMGDKERDILKRWIAGGAEYKQHWAFVPPALPPLPEVKNSSWPRTTIDRFVLARLEKEGLTPTPEADKTALVRRLYLDLTGLPPTPEEVDSFVNETSLDAYEKLVDRLLTSPRYGERWARRWMDLARYSDTNGYEKDRNRSIWPWRDWVINALNADMPFDRFSIEQIAGDMLPKATPDQIVATGFHRNTMLNEEGGIDPLEFRFHAMTDRVATTGTTWLGLTVGCAQCHTHKYDPITHTEYFSVMAFLNNTDEPDYKIPVPDAESRHKANLEKADKLIASLPGRFPISLPAKDDITAVNETQRRSAFAAKFAEWMAAERASATPWTQLRPATATSNLPYLNIQSDNSVLAGGDITKSDTYELSYKGNFQGITAISLEAMPDENLPGGGPGLAYFEGPKGDFFLGEFKVTADGQPVKFDRASHSYAKNNFGDKASAVLATDGDPQTGWTTAGRNGERHVAVFVPEKPISASELNLTMLFGRHFPCSLGRFRVSVTTKTGGAEANDNSEEIRALLAVPDSQLTAAQRETLTEAFLLGLPEFAKERAEVRRLRESTEGDTTLVMRERPPQHPRPTHRYHRGEYLSPKEEVRPGVIAAVAPFPDSLPRNRLGFAQWLVSKDNPLTARVTVNRQWHAFFGRGLVKTIDDFGFQGEAPSHPELLDWLAVEFMKQGWSLKKLHRLIVMSATYRQSSAVSPTLLAKDFDNRLLSRAPRLRLEGEMIRDSLLLASGLLNEKRGGPSVRPSQPAGVTEVAFGSPGWTASTGAERFRRSVYTFSKRTAPFAFYNTFDAPVGDACVARRDVSNTPLQALTLLNDVAIMEAAQALGKYLASQPGSPDERIALAFRRVLSRTPEAREIAVLRTFFETQKARFTQGELDAKAFAGDGPEPVERAAWTALARTLFNLDETVHRN